MSKRMEMVTGTGVVKSEDGHVYQKEVERGKGKIFYASDGSPESVSLADKVIFRDNSDVDVQMTLDTWGICSILNRKRQGFNILFCDFSVLDSVDGFEVVEAIKKFIKYLPGMPVFIFCNNREQCRKAGLFLGEFAKNIFLKSSENLQSFITLEIQDFLENRIPATVCV